MYWFDWTVEYHGVLSALAAVMSAVAAITLLALGISQHKWNQMHNKALVKPFLTGMLTSSKSSITFSVVNKGLGTALVDKLEARAGEQTMTMKELDQFLVERLPSFALNVGEFNNQYGFSPNERFDLVTLNVKSTPQCQSVGIQHELLSVLREVSIHVKYHSLLDNTELSYDSQNDLRILQTEAS